MLQDGNSHENGLHMPSEHIDFHHVDMGLLIMDAVNIHKENRNEKERAAFSH